MKKILTILIASMFWCNISFAKWVFIAVTSEDYYYYEDTTIKKDKDYSYVWILDDMIVSESPHVKSMKMYLKINCSLIQYDFMQIISYRFKLGTGASNLREYPKVQWSSAPPKTPFHEIMSVVCSK